MPYVTEANLTEIVGERWRDVPDPRLRQVIAAVVKHLHAFVREVEPTPEKWFAAIQFLTRVGQKCDDKRQEFILCSDVLGVSMLVNAINHRQASGATLTTLEGPFHLPHSPHVADGEDMAKHAPGVPCVVVGTVRDTDGAPVAGAILDIWQTDGEGLYEAQRDVAEPWMRAIYRSGADGAFVVRTVAPIGYTIPMDGPVGALMSRTNLSHMRQAHIHVHLQAPGFHPVMTQLFPRGDPYLDRDAVFGVKEPLIVDFEPQPPGTAPTGETIAEPYSVVRYGFVLERHISAAKARQNELTSTQAR